MTPPRAGPAKTARLSSRFSTAAWLTLGLTVACAGREEAPTRALVELERLCFVAQAECKLIFAQYQLFQAFYIHKNKAPTIFRNPRES